MAASGYRLWQEYSTKVIHVIITIQVMYLRSGTVKGLCRGCNEFYHNAAYKHTITKLPSCSACSEGPATTHFPWRTETFQTELGNWVQASLAETPKYMRNRVENMFRFAAKIGSVAGFSVANSLCVEYGVKLSSSFAQEICTEINFETTNEKPNIHQILPLVVDWWQLRQWKNSTVNCYYAHYDDSLEDIIKECPPPQNPSTLTKTTGTMAATVSRHIVY